MANIILKTVPGRFGVLAGGFLAAAAVWVSLGGAMKAAPPTPEAITCLPTCTETDARFLVVAGDDPTTLGSQQITIGLSFEVASGEANGNFALFDADRDSLYWDFPFVGVGSPPPTTPAPELIVTLIADPTGVGGRDGTDPIIATWDGPAGPLEQGPFPIGVGNNVWSGVSFLHNSAAKDDPDPGEGNYLYAIRVSPKAPAANQGWNAFKVRAAGTVLLLSKQIVGFLGAVKNSGTSFDRGIVYPSYPAFTPTTYDGTWSFKTRLPSLLGDVTVYDGDMDYGDSFCSYRDTNDPDSDETNPNSVFSPSGIPGFATGSAAVPEGNATTTSTCTSPGVGVRSGNPADDNSFDVFRRVTSIPNTQGIAYQLVAPDGQIFVNRNPSGQREWEQFKIARVNLASDIPGGVACPVGGFAETPGYVAATDLPLDNLYPASDCRTQTLPGGVWEIQLDGMDLANLNFWYFDFKFEPIDTNYNIGRLVWYDHNSNGIQDPHAGPGDTEECLPGVLCANEPGIPGVLIDLYQLEVGNPDPIRPVYTTDADGEINPGGPLDAAGPLLAGKYSLVIRPGNLTGGPLTGWTSTTGGETSPPPNADPTVSDDGIEVGLPLCINTNDPVGCGDPVYDEWNFGYVATGVCKAGPIGGINLGAMTGYLFFFENGTNSATWEGASPGYVGNVLANGLVREKTSGGVAYAGTISTGDTKLDAWQKIVDQNPGQAAVSTGNGALVAAQRAALLAAFSQINGLVATVGYTNRTPTSLNNLNTTGGGNQTFVINITSGFATTTKINITGDPGDVFILRWDSDANFGNGYQGKVKFSGGGGIVPLGGLTAANFIHVAGAITSSGGGNTPAPPYPQGPRLDNGTGNLITGGHDFNGGGFFTGYWLTTGEAQMSNGIFVGGWYTIAEKINMTSGTAGVFVCPTNAASIR